MILARPNQIFDLTALTEVSVMILGKILLMNKSYANTAANECAKHFLPFFAVFL